MSRHIAVSKHRAKWWSRLRIIRTYLFVCMFTFGLISYLAFTQPVKTEKPQVQEQLFDNVPSAIPGPPPKARGVEKGEALAYIRIPRFGDDWLWTVLEGTDMNILDKGPGHFVDSALPGGKGNTSYAAHRATHGDPFLDFDKLQVGDTVILSQSGAEWTYKITLEPTIIEKNDIWVVRPMKNGHWLTLTTCWPKYGSAKRMYIRAELASVK